MLNKDLELISEVHDEHTEMLKNKFKEKVIDLEMKLRQAEDKLDVQQNLLDQFKQKLDIDSSKISTSILEMLNKPKCVTDSEEKHHQEVVDELQRKLEELRKQYDTHLEQTKQKYDLCIVNQK